MITQVELKRCVKYNPKSGVFTRLISVPHSKAGTHITGENAEGYIVFSVSGYRTKAHRFAFLYMEGKLPTEEVDHINRVRNDNRWDNIQEVSSATNCQNRGAKCYSFAEGRKHPWRADITINGERFQQSFKTEDSAINYIKEKRT